jgi:predicted CXXCH cytochrome family protein
MRVRTAAISTIFFAALAAGCSAASRHKALTTFFDGVPPLESAEKPAGQPGAVQPAGTARPATGSQHGPYAARMCSACHDSGALNGLVLPKDRLCFQCHDLNLNKRYVHGPIASGGCLVCHDPHSSRYRNLLVSDSDSFCFGCHDQATVSRIDGHADLTMSCTTCHDAHQSNEKYLLK